AYIADLLASDPFVAIVAREAGAVIGALTAYELKKFARPESEIYIYDLAVAPSHRRQGVATALIARTKAIARQRGASVIFVQADQGDAPPIALYSRLGTRADVLHFDISPDP
ncbi:MAG: GNAT family N-acetyltransferase, partial [Pseudomonadota bacterium]